MSVEGESDFHNILGVDPSVHAGPLSLRVGIRLAANDATDDQLQEIVSRAESRSPVRDALARDVWTSLAEVATGSGKREEPGTVIMRPLARFRTVR